MSLACIGNDNTQISPVCFGNINLLNKCSMLAIQNRLSSLQLAVGHGILNCRLNSLDHEAKSHLQWYTKCVYEFYGVLLKFVTLYDCVWLFLIHKI